MSRSGRLTWLLKLVTDSLRLSAGWNPYLSRAAVKESETHQESKMEIFFSWNASYLLTTNGTICVQYILINVDSCGHFGCFKGVGSGRDVHRNSLGWPFAQNLKLLGDQRRGLNREYIKWNNSACNAYLTVQKNRLAFLAPLFLVPHLHSYQHTNSILLKTSTESANSYRQPHT